MNWIERYNNKEEVNVWNELRALDYNQLSETETEEVMAVVKETIARISHNISVIYEVFGLDYKHTQTADALLFALHNKTRPYGFLSVFLDCFLKNIDQVDFIQLKDKHFPHESELDPLYIASVQDMIALLSDGSWEEEMEDLMEEGKKPYLYISPDIYHKDHCSGGMPYGIVLEHKPVLDSFLCNTKYGALYFLDYLRLTFDHCGFTNLKEEHDIPVSYKTAIKSKLRAF